MTDRRIPTPKDIAPARCQTPLVAAPAPTCQAPLNPHPVEPVAAVAESGFDRVRWEQALMSSDAHGQVRLVGFTLAHYALGGQLPADSVQHSARMGRLTRLSQDRVRASLRDLERLGLISRPAVEGWSRDMPRPITLTVPETARTEPPHTGERP
ncbi:MAG TPA: hypothetical protein VJM75_01695 [Acidimicrobiales bacterium]|nr:hypothetical protein [Acidimicrobiales bacterium]